jgi:hypothetical protein
MMETRDNLYDTNISRPTSKRLIVGSASVDSEAIVRLVWNGKKSCLTGEFPALVVS